MMKNIGYARVSHLESVQGYSFDTQEKRLKDYISLHDLGQLDEFSKEVLSGGVEIRKRKVLSGILSQMKRGDRLFVSRICRLSRSILNTLEFVNDCKKKGVEVHIADLGCVTNGGVGQIVLNVLSCLAENERLQISERIKVQKMYAKKERRHLGGALEFGYKKDENNKLVPDDKEYFILQSMFNLRNQGLGYRQISEEVKKKFGRKIFFQQVWKILNRPHNQQLQKVA